MREEQSIRNISTSSRERFPLGGIERVAMDFRLHLKMTLLAPHRALLAARLFPCARARVLAQSSVQAVQRDVTSVSLQRIDRACYQD